MASNDEINHEEDISIITHSPDMSSSFVPDTDTLFHNFPQHRQIVADHSDSFQVFHQAYDNLKSRYNELYFKFEAQAKKLKEMENSHFSSSADHHTNSFLFVNADGNDNYAPHIPEITALNSQVTDLKQKLLVAESNIKSLKDTNFKIEETLRVTQHRLDNKISQEVDNNDYYRRKIDVYKERLHQLESIKGSDLQTEIIKTKNECGKLREENQKLVNELRHYKEENAVLKRKLTTFPYSNSPEVPACGQTGNSLTRGTLADLDQFSALSLNSSTNELRKLRQYIKSLKTTIENQHSALKKIEDNPAISRLLRESAQENGINRMNGDVQLMASKDDLSPDISVGYNHVDEAVARSSSTAYLRPMSESAILSPEENYDNVGHFTSPRSSNPLLKSHSEVICRSQSGSKDLQRSSSLAESSGTMPLFRKESAVYHPNPELNRYGDHGAFGSRVDPSRELPTSHSGVRYQPTPASSSQICPVCSEDFTRRTLEDFQTHVFNCVDADEEPVTLTTDTDSDRMCPMCNERFPSSVAQIVVDNHVNAHFGEGPVGDGFEILN